jgi:hypothetical protein
MRPIFFTKQGISESRFFQSRMLGPDARSPSGDSIDKIPGSYAQMIMHDLRDVRASGHRSNRAREAHHISLPLLS